MVEENVVIFKVGTEEAVQSLGDLKNNVKVLKEALDGLDIGTQEYQDTLMELRVNQNAVKDAMHATSSSLATVTQSATGAVESYNGLVHRMAALKEEFRSTTDEVRRGDLGKQIKQINDRLKEMDELQGNYQRNVGNYGSALNNLGSILRGMPGQLGSVAQSVSSVGGALKAVSSNPLMGLIGLIAPILIKIVQALKQNKGAIDAVKKATSALQPVMDLASKAIEVMAGWLAKAVEWLAGLAANAAGAFKTVVAGAVGVGNTLKESLLTPIRTIIEAFKGLGNVLSDVFTGNFKKVKDDAKAAMDGIVGAVKRGFSFKANFEAGKTVGEAFAAGLGAGRGKDKAASAGKELAEAFNAGLLDNIEVEDIGLEELERAMAEANKKAKARADQRIKDLDKAAKHQLELNEILTEDDEARAAKAYEIQKAANDRRLTALQDFAAQAIERGDLTAYLDYSQQAADLAVDIETNALREKMRLRQKDVEDAKAKAAEQRQIMEMSVGATSDIFSALAAIYEADGEANAKSAKRAKALQIASTTIDTISGAVAAYMNAVKAIKDPILGPIIGAAQAAAVSAAGYANIRKIQATDVSGKSTGSTVSAPAFVTAPTVAVGTPTTTTTNSTGEDTVNSTPGDSQPVQVYILDSQIQASNNATRTKVQESSF